MRYFAVSNGLRYDLAGDLTEAQARMVAETNLGLQTYQLWEQSEYWASPEGQADKLALDTQSVRQAIRLEADKRIEAINPALARNMELIRILWPMLDTSATPSDVSTAHAINEYARQQSERTDLIGYDPSTDQGWPA